MEYSRKHEYPMLKGEVENKSLKNLGVVVIGRNEGGRLTRCLESLQIDHKNVVYVDSGSTDRSVDEARRLGVAVVCLDPMRPFSAARARNEGFAALMELIPDIQFVQFVDGDCELIEGWLDVALSFLGEHLDVAVVCGRRRERFPEASVYNRLCDLEWDTPAGQTAACGGDSLMRVDSFKSVGGFREELMAGEEPELCGRLGARRWKVWRLDVEMTLHDAAITRFGQWWLRSVRCGYGYAAVSYLSIGQRGGLYKRETKRAVLWGGLIPIIIIGSLLTIHSVAITGVFVYPLQIARIALAQGMTKPFRWTYATYIMVAKFAEFQGVVRFFWKRLRGEISLPIEYKRTF